MTFEIEPIGFVRSTRPVVEGGKPRPDRLGLTVCRVSVAGRTLEVAGLDVVDGTPGVDLEPWYAAYGSRGPVHEPPWVAEVMAASWSEGAA